MLRHGILKFIGIFVFTAAIAVAGPAWAVVTNINYNEVGQTKDFKLEITEVVADENNVGDVVATSIDHDGDGKFDDIQVAQQHTEKCVQARLINEDGIVISEQQCLYISSADGSRVVVNGATGQVVVAEPVTPVQPVEDLATAEAAKARQEAVVGLDRIRLHHGAVNYQFSKVIMEEQGNLSLLPDDVRSKFEANKGGDDSLAGRQAAARKTWDQVNEDIRSAKDSGRQVSQEALDARDTLSHLFVIHAEGITLENELRAAQEALYVAESAVESAGTAGTLSACDSGLNLPSYGGCSLQLGSTPTYGTPPVDDYIPPMDEFGEGWEEEEFGARTRRKADAYALAGLDYYEEFGGPPPTTFYNPDGSRTPAPDGNGGAAASGAQRALDHETIEYRVSEINQESGSKQELFADAAEPLVLYGRSSRNLEQAVDTVESLGGSINHTFVVPKLGTSIIRAAPSADLELVSGGGGEVTRWEFTSDPPETLEVARISFHFQVSTQFSSGTDLLTFSRLESLQQQGVIDGYQTDFCNIMRPELGTMPDWADKAGAVGVGGNTTLGGTALVTFSGLASPGTFVALFDAAPDLPGSPIPGTIPRIGFETPLPEDPDIPIQKRYIYNQEEQIPYALPGDVAGAAQGGAPDPVVDQIDQHWSAERDAQGPNIVWVGDSGEFTLHASSPVGEFVAANGCNQITMPY